MGHTTMCVCVKGSDSGQGEIDGDVGDGGKLSGMQGLMEEKE